MILGYLIIGMLLGTIAAAISLFLGSSVLLALAVYSGVGSLCMLILAVFLYSWRTVIEGQTKINNATESRWQSL
ncbi:hypothetical protein RC74_16055 [Falsihalocynthiibacter arcticus]|uniref:Uncharacterized protein n=1 Tax=Falsihalocynthiibacter arcticus TaxID=1579316 RepID=A0A126V2S5_9RHOB|nr:hypothetical protein RC74_16055 [Falsihalocynthiibacter arcticus]